MQTAINTKRARKGKRVSLPPISLPPEIQICSHKRGKSFTLVAPFGTVKVDTGYAETLEHYEGDFYGTTFMGQYGNEYVATVNWLRIAEGQQGQGYGTRLLDLAIRLARNKGAVAIYLRSAYPERSPTRFFTKVGFRVVDGLYMELDTAKWEARQARQARAEAATARAKLGSSPATLEPTGFTLGL